MNNNHEELEKICINFHSTNQIKNWLVKTLSDMYNDIDLFDNQLSQSMSPRKIDKTSSIRSHRRTSSDSLNNISTV